MCSGFDNEINKIDIYKNIGKQIMCDKERIKELEERINKAIDYIIFAQVYGLTVQVKPHLKPYINGDELLSILRGNKE